MKKSFNGFAATLLAFAMSALCVQNVSAQSCNVPLHSDWMRDVKDNTPVRLLGIPGAHDAATGTISFYGASVQSKNVNTLFDAGVRYYDFRVGFTSGVTLRMYHGGMDLSRTFYGVMDDLYKKLDSHKDEFVIVEVTVESGTAQKDNCKDHLKSYFRKKYKDPEHDVNFTYWDDEKTYQWARDKWLEFRPDLTVKDCRGKVILLFNDEYDSFDKMVGAFIPGRGDGPMNETMIKYRSGDDVKYCMMFAQNQYHDDAINSNVRAKAERYAIPHVSRFTDFVNEHPDSLVWSMNFLSAYTDNPAAPNGSQVAEATNIPFARYLMNHPDMYVGIVLMDFCGETTNWGYTTSGDISVDAVLSLNWKFMDESKLKDRRKPNVINSN